MIGLLPHRLRSALGRGCSGPGFLLQWHVTERCNLRCAHCYQEAHAGDELDFDEQLGVVRQFRELLERRREATGNPRLRGHLTLTGGEPFVQSRFLELLQRVATHQRDFGFAVLTNGTLVDDALARRLRRLRPRFVQVSIEGRRETHDAIRGRGAYAAAVEGLKRLVRRGVRTMISFTASRLNYREFPAVARLGRRLGVQRVWADRLIPTGSGGSLRGDVLTPEETRAFFETMLASRREAARERPGWRGVAMHRALQFLVAGGWPYHCTAGETLLTIQPNGDLYPCRRMPIRIGNVLAHSLADLYETDPLLRRLRDPASVSDDCQDCDHADFCRGGLRCLSYAVNGDPLSRDPGCWLEPARVARR